MLGFRADHHSHGGDRRLFRLLARNLAIGTVVAVGTVAGLLASDAHGLRHLVLNDRDPVLGVLLLAFGFIITLGSAAMGAAVMTLPRDAGQGGRRVPPRPLPNGLTPLRVAALPARRART